MTHFKHIYIFISFFLGAISTYYLAMHVGVVIGASVVGLVGSFVPNKSWQAAIYSGTFAGMSSTFVVGGIGELLLTSITGGLLLILLERKFIGVGGKLGATAFVSVLSLIAIKALL